MRLTRYKYVMFTAHFLDGPLKGGEAGIASPLTPETLWWAPSPVPGADGVNAHMLIGYKSAGTDAAPRDATWPGTIAYELDRGLSQLQPHPDHVGMETGMAVFRHREDS